MADKYLRKSEFRYHSNPRYFNSSGRGHVAYVMVKHGNMYRINAITPSKHFKNHKTVKLPVNPKKVLSANGSYQPDSSTSYISIPFWEHKRYLKSKPFGVWKFSKSDKKFIRKHNKKYFKKMGMKIK